MRPELNAFDLTAGCGVPRVLPADAARDGFMRQNMRLDVAASSSAQKQFAIVVRNFGHVRVADIDPAPSRFTRARRHLADGRDIISLVISRGGRFGLDGVGEVSCAAPGAVALESRCESVFHSPDAARVWTICMDRAPIEPMLRDMRSPVQQCIPADTPALRLLASYLTTLSTLEGPCAPLVGGHIRDLSLYALGISSDTKAHLRERSVTQVRLHVALDHLKLASAEPGLDPAKFAARLNISVRYLHRMLEPTGRTFSEHLIKCRLERASAMLSDPTSAHLRIGDIASRAGFADVSHFNRSFRRAFGETPRSLRRAAVVG
jgi:AraC-like DNA-binding protein